MSGPWCFEVEVEAGSDITERGSIRQRGPVTGKGEMAQGAGRVKSRPCGSIMRALGPSRRLAAIISFTFGGS